MTRFLFSHLPIALLFAMALTVGGRQQIAAATCDDVCESDTQCGEYGTTVTFVNSPAEAAKQALKVEKLVFVLHVSGNFETPDYT